VRTWTVLALVVASLAACLPRQAIAAAMQANNSGSRTTLGDRLGNFEQETPRMLGACEMKIESENGDSDGSEEVEDFKSLAAWSPPCELKRQAARPGGAIARRAEHSPESLQDRTTVRRC
jgi:hypothetical protein